MTTFNNMRSVVEGMICSKPVLTMMHDNRLKASFIVCANDSAGYVPCVAADLEAEKAAALNPGDSVHISGTFKNHSHIKAGFNELVIETIQQ